jgi:nitrous oxidase accessory protein/Cu-processing system ATP-binding protein
VRNTELGTLPSTLGAVAFVVLIGASIADARTWQVSPRGPLTSLTAALDQCSDGDTIEVDGGHYAGPIEVSRRVALVGRGWPTLDGGGEGTVVRVRGAGTRLSGFHVRGSGILLDGQDAAVAVEAPDAVIEGNRIDDALFGILLSKADRAVVRRNHIEGKPLDVPRRGDAIRVWYSNDVRLEGNVVLRSRDVVVWYSRGAVILGNRVEDGRYGLHFMYCDDARVEANQLARNSVGSYLMYSRRLHLRRNWISASRGPSGYGVGLKDMDDAVIESNLLIDNRIGAYLDNSPREMDSTTRFSDNLIAYNDVGVEMQPLLRRNFLAGNSFIGNEEQVGISGGGELRGNFWSVGGRGNYWSDYAGYDADGDGIGDIPYRAERFFEQLADRQPSLQLFRFSPATAAVDFAARAFPVIRPQPKLEDERPLMSPRTPPGVPRPAARSSVPLALTGGGLLLFAGMLTRAPSPPAKREPDRGEASAADPILVATEVCRSFGRLRAVDGLDLEVRRGEAVALWGRNGAGKTTALRCMLGLLPCRGTIRLDGLDVHAQGKRARRSVGFVPQEVRLHDDLVVAEALDFYASLRGASATPPHGALERLGLDGQLHKRAGELSGGRRRLLALAIALLGDPPLLVLDEPMSNLDTAARDAFVRLLAELKEAGTTIVFTTHRLREVLRLADRVVVLEHGKKVAEGAPRELADRLGGRLRLQVELPSESIDAAIALLTEHGIASTRNGHGIHVEVAVLDKAEPLRVLIGRGLTVENFEVQWGEEG